MTPPICAPGWRRSRTGSTTHPSSRKISKVLGLDLDEIIPGRGDGLVAEKRSRFPAAFQTEEHLSVALSHAEELWNPALQAEIVKRLKTFQ